eukprot:356868-Chlamydomonas_euryale.AAC.11
MVISSCTPQAHVVCKGGRRGRAAHWPAGVSKHKNPSGRTLLVQQSQSVLDGVCGGSLASH